MKHTLRYSLCMLLVTGLAACQPTATPAATQSSSAELAQAITPIPTLALRATQTQSADAAPAVIHLSADSTSPTPEPSQTPLPPSPTAAPTQAATAETVVVESLPTETGIPATELPTLAPMTPLPRVDHYLFARPFPRSDTLVDYIDRTYPYGGTQQGNREVHLGDDYANPRNTPILSIGAGTVVFAGTDDSTRVGPDYNYYGNVVVIRHDALSPEGLPVYSLYGHMQTINVKTDQYVMQGIPVGTIGDSGIAIGPHLHLEIRVGGNGLDYRTTRNPDLWIAPYPGYGTLAGRISNQNGMPVRGQLVLVRSGSRTRETYTYGERVNGDAVWQENFTLGDLPAGTYEVVISDNGNIRFRQDVSILNGQTAFVEIVLNQ